MSRFPARAAGGALIVALVTAVVACGGGGKKAGDTTATSVPATPATSATARAGTPAATPSVSAGETPSSGDGGNADDVRAAAKKFGRASFKATYTINGSGSNTVSNGTMVLEKDGEKRFRFDLTAQQDGKDSTIIFIETGDTSAFCLKDAGDFGALLGIAEGEGVCFNSDSNDESNPVAGLSTSLKDFENADVSVLETSGRVIAGQEATCYRTRDNGTDAISTTCFNSDGVILYVQNEGTDFSTLEAKSVSNDINPDDFKLPYEVKDLPTGDSSTP